MTQRQVRLADHSSRTPSRYTVAGALGAAFLAAWMGFAAAAEPNAADKAARQSDLDAVNRKIGLSSDRLAALQKEIDALAKDRATLNDALLDATQREQRIEGQLTDSEARMAELERRQAKLRDSLNARRNVLAEVLAALQRMGRSPPPAILVRPEDALDSLRSAILLGAVVPNLKVDADALAIDLAALAALRADVARERDIAAGEARQIAEDGHRIELLLAEKRKAEAASADALQAERDNAAQLASQALSLKDLIAAVEKAPGATGKAADDARRADARRVATGAQPPATDPNAKAGVRTAALGAADRIAPAMAFTAAKGLLPKPVSGVQIRGFGDDDGLGSKSPGISIRTRSGAQVSSPVDGWVVFSGPFRSYGQLLIINAGGGYHVLLAGMERSDVELGQFVLAGEPVAVMGDRRLASVGAIDVGQPQPLLYVEFRKDGNSIDPGPWWAPRNDEKAAG